MVWNDCMKINTNLSYAANDPLPDFPGVNAGIALPVPNVMHLF